MSSNRKTRDGLALNPPSATLPAISCRGTSDRGKRSGSAEMIHDNCTHGKSSFLIKGANGLSYESVALAALKMNSVTASGAESSGVWSTFWALTVACMRFAMKC